MSTYIIFNSKRLDFSLMTDEEKQELQEKNPTIYEYLITNQ
jgi:hypothetical protein